MLHLTELPLSGKAQKPSDILQLACLCFEEQANPSFSLSPASLQGTGTVTGGRGAVAQEHSCQGQSPKLAVEGCEEGKAPAAPWILPLTLTSDWPGELHGQTET